MIRVFIAKDGITKTLQAPDEERSKVESALSKEDPPRLIKIQNYDAEGWTLFRPENVVAATYLPESWVEEEKKRMRNREKLQQNPDVLPGPSGKRH